MRCDDDRWRTGVDSRAVSVVACGNLDGEEEGEEEEEAVAPLSGLTGVTLPAGTLVDCCSSTYSLFVLTNSCLSGDATALTTLLHTSLAVVWLTGLMPSLVVNTVADGCLFS